MAGAGNNHTASESSLTSPIYIVEDKVAHGWPLGQDVAPINFYIDAQS